MAREDIKPGTSPDFGPGSPDFGPGVAEIACHSAHTTLERPDGNTVRIDQLSAGDVVATSVGYEPVLGFAHAVPASEGTMLYYRLATAKTSLDISAGHWLFLDGEAADPATAQRGSLLETRDGPVRVENVTIVHTFGAYHLITASGTYYASGVLCTDYHAAYPRWVLERILRPYVAMRFHLGVPVRPETGSPPSGISNFAVYNAYETLGIPSTFSKRWLWPLTVGSMLTIGLLNLVVAAVQSAPIGKVTTGLMLALLALAAAGCLQCARRSSPAKGKHE